MSLIVDIDAVNSHSKFINIIRHNSFCEKKELVKALGVSFPTMEKEFKELNLMGLIDYQKNAGTSKFFINGDYGYFLGIAVGATETKVSLVDFSFKPVRLCEDCCDGAFYSLWSKLDKEFEFKNLADDYNNDEVQQYLCFKTERRYLQIYEMCNRVLEIFLDFFDKSDKTLFSVALSLPGIMDKTNIMRFSPNIPELLNLDATKLIKSDFLDKMSINNITFLICHDTIAATVYEKENLYAISDDYSNKENMAVLYMGSGLGCGIIIHNQLVLGAASAAEIGHINFSFQDLPRFNDDEERDFQHYDINDNKENYEKKVEIDEGYCACGKKDCLERLIRVKVFNADSLENYLQKTTKKELLEFPDKHPYRYRVLKELIGKALNVIINFSSVDLIAFTGRIFNNIPKLKEEMESLKTGYSLKVNAEMCHILTEKTPDDSVAIGAAILSYYKMCNQFGENKTINWSLFKGEE